MSDRHRRIVQCVAVLCLLAAPAGAFTVQSSIGLVAVTDAPEGTELVLEDGAGREVARGTADRLGA